MAGGADAGGVECGDCGQYAELRLSAALLLCLADGASRGSGGLLPAGHPAGEGAGKNHFFRKKSFAVSLFGTVDVV